MDPSSNDDECLSVQLDSSDMAPNAEKVLFLIQLDISTHFISRQLDNPSAEVSNEALSYRTWWEAIECGESDGVSRIHITISSAKLLSLVGLSTKLHLLILWWPRQQGRFPTFPYILDLSDITPNSVNTDT